jgi:hypothetical protein
VFASVCRCLQFFPGVCTLKTSLPTRTSSPAARNAQPTLQRCSERARAASPPFENCAPTALATEELCRCALIGCCGSTLPPPTWLVVRQGFRLSGSASDRHTCARCVCCAVVRASVRQVGDSRVEQQQESAVIGASTTCIACLMRGRSKAGQRVVGMGGPGDRVRCGAARRTWL